ncbi:beta-lactamase class C [Ameyamaea chiangmaiensis NBRC 103196]|uniref:D-aminopeptidase n=1 Tax=Ameyamaea chiangmaiensis TaxID=442969 RepID=A0A850P6Z2_9PROT|nr:D-aminopeptidase [Ameyamaea chiangmaiensis]MBS4074942.1 D-aminopeptidase [Ameyamaea chiangmaiensis]NVN39708.1 D-aminopeptidase [Ameyamaea chiangmaiensis]GBQ63281.1 beta-lactamase class C [Ameyamaea chiangmaiensis NBRC 103196]
MPSFDPVRATAFLDSLPDRYRGPGGVAGIVHEGRVVARHAWGFADLGRHQPMTAGTPLPICSISKQFTCATLLSALGDTTRFDGRVGSFFPSLEGPLPTIAQMCHNQSGLRDYWALTVLHGATPDAPFRRSDAAAAFARMRRTHFAPGTSYSYSNGNFRVLSDLLETETGRSLDELYRAHVFGRAGMGSMVFTPDTAYPAGGVTGYEGSIDVGFFPAENRIFWTGDAGLSGSLDDMLAWEAFIDATRDDPDSLYRRIAAPPTFSDGTPARYGYGLAHGTIAGIPVTGHGGALRGFRAQRFHAADARLSVVVLLNHEASAYGAASGLLAAALGASTPRPTHVADPAWNGVYLDGHAGLALRVSLECDGQLIARYGTGPERLAPGPADSAASDTMTLHRHDGCIALERPGENYRAEASRVAGAARPDIAGVYACAELDSGLTIVATGGGFYAAASGFLGTGPMQPLYPLGDDVWTMPCQRSMDAPAPGDWTIRIRRSDDGRVSGLQIGCWLARGLSYDRHGD